MNARRALRYALGIVAVLAVPAGSLCAQDTRVVIVRVRARTDSSALDDARVAAGLEVEHTDETGRAVIRAPAAVAATLRIARLGFLPVTLVLDPSPRDTAVAVWLDATRTQLAQVVVVASRAERRVEDIPERVEVLARDEVEDQAAVAPGNIAQLLGETRGVRLQTTSPTLGTTAIRIQGLRGRYTLLLNDGLPLQAVEFAGLGPLQTPPLDLERVELVKGAASALYGPAALGGVVNLVSRRPPDTPETTLLTNVTERGGRDAALWSARTLGGGWGYTALANADHQRPVDLDGEGWADVASYDRATFRPRFFWSDARGRSVMATLAGVAENRRGGTVPDRVAPDGTPFVDELRTRRGDAGLVARIPLADSGRGGRVVSVRTSGALAGADRSFGGVRERRQGYDAFVEATLGAGDAAFGWVVGAAAEATGAHSPEFAVFDYDYAIPAVFAQLEHVITDRVSVSASARMDAHSRYGALVSPRLSTLTRLGGGWTARLAAGAGSSSPTPMSGDADEAALAFRVAPGALRPETIRSVSLDVGRTAGWVEHNIAVFTSRVDHPLVLQDVAVPASFIALVNADEPVRTAGVELFSRLRWRKLAAAGTYAVVTATEGERDGPGRRTVPLTPRHAGGVTVTWEDEDTRLGMEAFYTGRQALEDDPYRSASHPYINVDAVFQQRIGAFVVYAQAENLFDVRQMSYEPLLLPRRGRAGRWTVDAWGPIEGRQANIGVRLEFGRHGED